MYGPLLGLWGFDLPGYWGSGIPGPLLLGVPEGCLDRVGSVGAPLVQLFPSPLPPGSWTGFTIYCLGICPLDPTRAILLSVIGPNSRAWAPWKAIQLSGHGLGAVPAGWQKPEQLRAPGSHLRHRELSAGPVSCSMYSEGSGQASHPPPSGVCVVDGALPSPWPRPGGETVMERQSGEWGIPTWAWGTDCLSRLGFQGGPQVGALVSVLNKALTSISSRRGDGAAHAGLQ